MSTEETNEEQNIGLVREIQAKLAERDERIREAAASLAHMRHEINNALTGILGQSQLLLREELTEKSRSRVETIQQLATRIGLLVVNLSIDDNGSQS